MNARSTSAILAGLVTLFASAALSAADRPVTVQVIHAPAWSEGDEVREGAGGFMILLEVARLTHAPARGGLVGVGDRRGLFGAGAEQALQQAALHGIPVVKLAPNGRVLPAPHGLFLDGCGLSEADAAEVLGRCLSVHGTLPVAGDGATEAQLAQLRQRLELYQKEFTLAAVTRLAAR